MDPPPPPPPPLDLLSSLPEHLQDEILTRLDLRDAVRTSALSRAWRRRWEAIPGLALSFPDGTPPSVVNRVLLRYAGPSVSRFATYVDGDDNDDVASASHVDDWLIALSRRSVESISIFNYCGGRFTVHSSLFSCNRLVSLSLEECCIPPLLQPQPQPGFPVLKDLYLKFVEFADNGESQLRAIIGASPMLRVLVLDEVHASYTDCVIEAPNLHTLGLISSIHWRFGELPRLQYACILVPIYLQGGRAGFKEFLAGVSKVRELIFNLPLCDFKMDAIPFTFSKMKSMELTTDFANMQLILLMFCLLRSSPNLEKLKIEVRRSKMVANLVFLTALWTDGMCANLQVVEIISYFGWLSLDFIELVLSKASCLRTLSVDACPDSEDDLDVLLNCRRASPQAQVLFEIQLEKINFDGTKFAEKRQIRNKLNFKCCFERILQNR